MAVLELIDNGKEIGIRVDTNINFYKKSDVSVISTDGSVIDFIVNNLIVASATPLEFLYPKEASLYDLMLLIKGILSGNESLYVPYPTVRVTNTDGNTYNISAGGSFICTPSTPTTPSGIAYRFPPITGALTSYAVDDAAYNEFSGLTDTYTPPAYPVYFQNLDETSFNPFIILLYNNEAGGTERFTDENNLQVFAAGLIKDHLTKKMWLLKATATWANALTSASGASDGGFTDWRIPDINELNTIIDKNVGLGYAPFSFNTDQIWTSNTSASNTLRASTFETDTRGRLLDQVKTSVFKVIYVRNW